MFKQKPLLRQWIYLHHSVSFIIADSKEATTTSMGSQNFLTKQDFKMVYIQLMYLIQCWCEWDDNSGLLYLHTSIPVLVLMKSEVHNTRPSLAGIKEIKLLLSTDTNCTTGEIHRLNKKYSQTKKTKYISSNILLYTR